MGWKTIKEHYKIKHIVQVKDNNIAIGSAYIDDIIKISKEGKLLKRYEGRSNKDLARYQQELDRDEGDKLKTLIEQKDTFDKNVEVFTYKDGHIVKQKCEEPNFPNVTHCGNLMYDNLYSIDYNKVVEWCKEDARLGVKFAKERIDKLEKDLLEYKNLLSEQEGFLRLANQL